METKFRKRQDRKRSETRMYVGGHITDVHEEQPGRDLARDRLRRDLPSKVSPTDTRALSRVHRTPRLQKQSEATNDPTKDNKCASGDEKPAEKE